MAFRKHNPNTLGPLQSDETWKVPHHPTKRSSTNDHFRQSETSSIDGLLDIDTLIRQFENVTHGKENYGEESHHVDDGLHISNRLADLHDPRKSRESIGGDVLPLSGTKKELIVSPEPSKQASYASQANDRNLYSSDVTNDRLPSFRLPEPPSMIRTSDGTSSFPMQVLGRRKNTSQIPANTKPTPSPSNERSMMNYSLAARQYLPNSKSIKPTVAAPYRDATQHSRKHSGFYDDHAMHTKAEHYSRQIRGLTSKLTVAGAKGAEQVLRSMISKYNEGVHKVRPNGASYNGVIHAYASLGMPSEAEEILFLMFDDWQLGNEDAVPNVRIFTSVLKAWQRAKTSESPIRCEKIIEAMNELSSDPRLANCKPDAYAMTALMHSWIDSPHKNVAEKVDRIFRTMQREFLAGDKNMRPDCIIYSLVLNAYVREFATKKAEAILWEMVQDYVGGNERALPRVRNFNTILAMYARSSRLNAPDRAEAVVAKFLDLCNRKKLPLKPDVYTYSQLLKTWVTSGRKDAIDKAVVCFYWMKKLGEEGDDAAAPDVIKYSTIIFAYTNAGDYQQARSMLEVMTADYLKGNQNAVPNTVLYDKLITCCLGRVDKRNMEPLKAADAIITELWCLSETIPKLRPTMKMYTVVIEKHVEVKNPLRAHSLLMDLLVTRRRAVGNPSMDLCNKVLDAWKNSNHPSKKSYMFRIRVAMFEVQK